ncbi:hypothetical protein ACLK1Z_15955 [Escherichia coli]
MDSKLAELGGERLLDRVDADVEYQAAASEWRARAVDALKSRAPVANFAIRRYWHGK